MNNKLTVQRMAFIAVFAALMCVCAWIAVPAVGTSFTLQTFAIILAGLVLSPFDALLSGIVYILLGVVGLPVFSSFGTLYSRIGTPYGGYIIGFVFAPFVISLVKNLLCSALEKSGKDNKAIKTAVYVAVAIVLGILVIDIPGVVQHKLMTGAPWFDSIALAALAFLPTDLLKCVLAAVVALAIEKPLGKLYR